MSKKFSTFYSLLLILFLFIYLYDISYFATAYADSPEPSIDLDTCDNIEQIGTDKDSIPKHLAIYQSLRSRLYWKLFEKSRGKYGSYKDFKQCWDPKTKIWKEFKNWVKEPDMEANSFIKDRDNNILSNKNKMDQLKHEAWVRRHNKMYDRYRK